MIEKNQDLLSLVGRILLAILFVFSGFGKVTGYAGTASYMASHGLPMVSILLPVTIVVEFGGALALILGWCVRPVALILFLFLIAITLVFHTGGDPASNIELLKNTAIMGGMLVVAAHGAGRFSLDGRQNR
jgi:putative oxidoreductase